MIIFNTIKAAEHYVKFCNKTRDYETGGYNWSSRRTYIDGQYVLISDSGDSCGCGCDMYRYHSVMVLGRIKGWNVKSIRHEKLKGILETKKPS